MIREMLLISEFHALFGKACSALKVAWNLQPTIVVYQDNLTKNLGINYVDHYQSSIRSTRSI